MTYSFQMLPKTLDQLKAMPEAALTDPAAVAALCVAALCVYPENKDEAIQMINYLKGPQPLSVYETQFIRDRFMDGKDYLPRSYFAGATPQNNYAPTMPYTICVEENPYSRAQLAEGYLKLFVRSGGADSPREIKLRTKPSTGQWFIWEFGGILSGIRIPAASDPWA